MRGRERTLQQIRALRSLGVAPRRRVLPRQARPDAIRLEYWKAIVRVAVEPARAIVAREVFPLLPRLVEEAKRERGDSVRFDASGRNTSEAVKRAARKFAEVMRPRELEALADQFAKRTSDFNRAQLRAQVRAATGVDVIRAEPYLAPKVEAFTVENVGLIRTVPERYFSEIESITIRGVRSGMLARDLERELIERGNVSEERAALIARDQIGKFYGDLNATRQQDLGVDRYVWRSVHDNRVRSEHEERDGNVYAWTPAAASGEVEYLPPDEQPGQPIQCRCFAEPDFSNLLAKL